MLALDGGESVAVHVRVRPTELAKCNRCWRYANAEPETGDLCTRCASVVAV